MAHQAAVQTGLSRFADARVLLRLAAVVCIAVLGHAQLASAQSTRSFALASAPLQIDVDSALGWSFSFDGMAADLDMIDIHQDFFGIPWRELAAGEPLPATWVAFQQEIRDRALATGLPIYLSLTPMSSDRVSLSPYVKETDNGFRLVERWSEACFDFANDPIAPDVLRSYLDFVDRMIEGFQPTYLTTVIEINEYLFACPEERWPGFVEFANEVYAHVKARWPEMIVFPSFLVDPYWVEAQIRCPADPLPCLEEAVAPLLALDKDRFGVSTYPLVQRAAGVGVPEGLIRDLATVADAPLAVAETGYNSVDVVVSGPPLVGSCRKILGSSDAEQAAFMQSLFEDADALGIDLVTWWSFRDYLPREVGGVCPCPLSEFETCLLLSLVPPFEQALFRSFGNMGVFYNDRSAKPVLPLWRSWRERPILRP